MITYFLSIISVCIISAALIGANCETPIWLLCLYNFCLDIVRHVYSLGMGMGMTDDPYTIEPFGAALAMGGGTLIAGDVIDMLTGATIVGPYCEWPKRECREFVVVGVDYGSKPDWTVLKNSPEFIEKCDREFDLEYPIKPVKKKKDWQHRYPWEK